MLCYVCIWSLPHRGARFRFIWSAPCSILTRKESAGPNDSSGGYSELDLISLILVLKSPFSARGRAAGCVRPWGYRGLASFGDMATVSLKKRLIGDGSWAAIHPTTCQLFLWALKRFAYESIKAVQHNQLARYQRNSNMFASETPMKCPFTETSRLELPATIQMALSKKLVRGRLPPLQLG